MEQKEWIIVTETSVGGVYEKKDGSVIVTSTYDGKGMIHTVHYKNATQTPTTEHIPEEIIREWIEKAKPLVDSAYNLGHNTAIGHAIGIVAQNTINEPDRVRVVLEHVIQVLSNLKKNIQ